MIPGCCFVCLFVCCCGGFFWFLLLLWVFFFGGGGGVIALESEHTKRAFGSETNQGVAFFKVSWWLEILVT